jgi:DNA-binding response OmpR family regulator
MTEPCILIVESDILVRHPLAQYLRDCEFRVLVAASYQEARDHFADPQQLIEVVLADVEAGDETGFEFAVWIRRHHPGVQLILTATLAKAVEKAGQLCRENPVIKKPLDHRHVLDHIKRLLAARDRNKATDDG